MRQKTMRKPPPVKPGIEYEPEPEKTEYERDEPGTAALRPDDALGRHHARRPDDGNEEPQIAG